MADDSSYSQSKKRDNSSRYETLDDKDEYTGAEGRMMNRRKVRLVKRYVDNDLVWDWREGWGKRGLGATKGTD